jgi:hypothetical protein
LSRCDNCGTCVTRCHFMHFISTRPGRSRRIRSRSVSWLRSLRDGLSKNGNPHEPLPG